MNTVPNRDPEWPVGALRQDPKIRPYPYYWNDLVIGIVIATLALVRTVVPRQLVWFSGVNIALGLWLLAAPSLLAYRGDADARAVIWNDVITGLLVIVLATTSLMLSSRRHRSATGEPTGR